MKGTTGMTMRDGAAWETFPPYPPPPPPPPPLPRSPAESCMSLSTCDIMLKNQTHSSINNGGGSGSGSGMEVGSDNIVVGSQELLFVVLGIVLFSLFAYILAKVCTTSSGTTSATKVLSPAAPPPPPPANPNPNPTPTAGAAAGARPASAAPAPAPAPAPPAAAPPPPPPPPPPAPTPAPSPPPKAMEHSFVHCFEHSVQNPDADHTIYVCLCNHGGAAANCNYHCNACGSCCRSSCHCNSSASSIGSRFFTRFLQ